MPVPSDDTLALLALAAAGGATPPRRALLASHGTAAAALRAGPSAWRAAGLDGVQCRAFARPAHAGSTLEWLTAPDHRLVGWHDADYPALLRRGADPPLAFFLDGDVTALWHPGIAIVGTRRPTAGGRDHARDFATAFCRAGFSVVSGLATGIDATAHEAALDAGAPTVAVLGTGVDVPYPRRHAGLRARVAAAGAVVSEYPPGTQAQAWRFPDRNRIVAALSLGTLVVEAAHRSGALITARLAADAGREVFALPGSIDNPMARGCHRLLREGAALVESPAEVIAALAPVAATLGDALRRRIGAPIPPVDDAPAGARTGPIHADADSHRLWDALGHDPTGMDRLVERTGLTAARLSSMLLVMELEGRVETAFGRYSRKS